MRRMTISVADEIPDMLEHVAGGERKKGEWLSKMVRAAFHSESTPDANDIESLRYQMIGMMAELNSVKTRVGELEANQAECKGAE